MSKTSDHANKVMTPTNPSALILHLAFSTSSNCYHSRFIDLPLGLLRNIQTTLSFLGTKNIDETTDPTHNGYLPSQQPVFEQEFYPAGV